MSASQGCIDDKEVVEKFKEALSERVGADRYRMWFGHGVEFSIHDNDREQDDGDSGMPSGAISVNRPRKLVVRVRGQFALDRLRKNFMRELRGAAMQACGTMVDVQICLNDPPASQTVLPLDTETDTETDISSTQSASVAQRVDCKREHADKPTSKSTATFNRGGRPGAARYTSGRRSGGRPSSLSSLIASGAGRGPQRTSSIRASRQHAVETSGTAPMQCDVPGTELQQLELPMLGDGNISAADSSSESNREVAVRSSSTVHAPITKSQEMTVTSFVAGPSNQLAYTALVMVCQNPSTASPLFLSGPTGAGKTHMMAAIADQFRRRHRMRRVMHLSAEQFTNDFITSVGNSGITAFRRRYREVDALLIDDVQFLGSKKATLRELLYTVETLAGSGRPLVFSGLQSPTEIPGLSRELAGRMAAGLVCNIQPLDAATRETILRRWLEQRCPMKVPDAMIAQINATLSGDGRVLSGVVNVLNTLQRMYGRIPTMDELRRVAGDLLRSAAPIATLNVIESAVCEAFQLPSDTLRGGSQTRAVTEPRMLAMYLSRQLTSSAYAEIARHFGGKSHSTAISAENNVKSWLQSGKPIGRGRAAMTVQEAIDRVEGLLRSG